MSENKYPVSDLEIILLGDSTSKFIEDFECDIKELEDFLKEDALFQTKESVNTTYLWMSRKDRNLISYVTLCTDAIHLDNIRKKLMKEQNIPYKSLPALKICRMAVRKDYTRQGLGKRMVGFAIEKALKINEDVACRFITLDSKNDEEIPDRLRPIRFYKKIGFEELKTKEKSNTIYCFYNLIDFIRQNSIR